MDFGDVLEEWERIKRERQDSSESGPPKRPGGPSSSEKDIEAWLGANGISDKDAEADRAQASRERGGESRRLAARKPQAVLDLHGMTAEEAESAIASFIDSASRSGLEKVLIIHGKGLHSSGAPVLKKAARKAVEAHPLAGRMGEADKEYGGTGALWVLIRSRGPREG